MSDANYAGLSPADFEAAIATRLPPRGLAWTRLPGSVFQGFWRVVADAVAAVHARAGALTEQESFPPTSVELLPDWEAVLGLPDPCLGANPATAARQASVRAKLAGAGGQTIGYFTMVAQQLGATVEISEYAPFRWGLDGWGASLRTASWAYVWLINLTGTTLFQFEWGVSSWGEPFWQVPGGAVQCEIQRLAPAHTIVIFTANAGVNVGGVFLSDLSLTDSLAGAA